MKLTDRFGYDNPLYAPLRDPARAVVEAYQNANRFFDTTQEYVYIEHGLVHFAHLIHNHAHAFPQLFDLFGDILHERHLMIEYPATPELDWRAELIDIDSVFELIIRVLDSIQFALGEFHAVTDTPELKPMALAVEELMTINSATYTKFLEMWKMYEHIGSYTSFDSWCEELADSDEGTTEED